MISTFPYYPKSYQPSGSGASGLASPKYSSGWSDMLGIVADPASSYGPSQQALGMWGSNTSPGESQASTNWEDVLGSFQPNQPSTTATETAPAPAPTAPPAPTLREQVSSWLSAEYGRGFGALNPAAPVLPSFALPSGEDFSDLLSPYTQQYQTWLQDPVAQAQVNAERERMAARSLETFGGRTWDEMNRAGILYGQSLANATRGTHGGPLITGSAVG